MSEATRLFGLRNWTEALAAGELALAADPGCYSAITVRSQSLINLARIPEGVASLRQALETAPAPDVHSSLLWQLNFLAETTPEAVFAEARRWNELHASPQQAKISPHGNSTDPDRSIRVGYLSPDLYQHAIMKFLPPVFELHDRLRFEVFVYAVGSKADPRIGANLQNYVRVPDSPDEIADRIRADAIDVLVDLAGHTNWRSLLALAQKPAPIQIAWLGCMFTSGLSTMDYFLGDAWIPAPDAGQFFTEAIYRMPGACCCYRPFNTIPLAQSPCMERGFITFGSFNSPGKITREVVKLWSAILHLVPNSRLFLKYRGMDTRPIQTRFQQWFAADGITADRLRFAGESTDVEYLRAYADIDIALDPFPYNGGSTTFDTAWMGVPIVTMTGSLTVQRSTAGVLLAMGLDDSIAETPEQYLRTAVTFAQVVPRAPALRQNIRQALKASALMDEIGLVRRLEAAYRDMWQTWCEERKEIKHDVQSGISALVG